MTDKATADKVTIFLHPVADAPQLKQKKFALDKSNTVAKLTKTLSRMMNLQSDQSLFLYISQTFAPSPDHTLEILRECYGTGDGEKELVFHYSVTPAWG